MGEKKRQPLKVRYSETVPERHPAAYAHALKVEVVSGGDYDDHVFVFQRGKLGDGDYRDEFIQIASPVDLEEIPENAPDLDRNMPYYRAKEVTLWFRCVTDMRLAKDRIRADLATLVATVDTVSGPLDKETEESYG